MLGVHDKSTKTIAAKDEKFKNDCLQSASAIPGPLAVVAVHRDYFASEDCAKVLDVVPALKCPGYPVDVLSVLKNFTFPDCLLWTPLVGSFAGQQDGGEEEDGDEDDGGGELICSKWVHKAICIHGASCFPDSLNYPQLNNQIDLIQQEDQLDSSSTLGG